MYVFLQVKWVFFTTHRLCFLKLTRILYTLKKTKSRIGALAVYQLINTSKCFKYSINVAEFLLHQFAVRYYRQLLSFACIRPQNKLKN